MALKANSYSKKERKAAIKADRREGKKAAQEGR